MQSLQGERSNPFVWFAGIALLLIFATLSALAIVLLFGGSSGDGSNDGASGPSAAASPAPLRPVLARDVALRAAPHLEASAVVEARAGAPVRPIGRLADSSWLVVEVVGRSEAIGWIPAGAVAGGGDLAALPVVADPAGGLPTSTGGAGSAPTATPDLPDLAITEVHSQNNQLVVTIANEGDADVRASISVSVAEGGTHRVDVAGKPLRPGDVIAVPLDGEYVQRRATILVFVTGEGVAELDAGNNRINATVSPDLPNDLEILDVEVAPTLEVVLRNNSPIPLVGSVTIGVRETHPSNLLVARLDAHPLEIAADGGTQVVTFPDLSGLDPTRIQVILQTDAINDANPVNDIFPR